MALDPVVNFFRSTIATLPVASGGTSIVLQTGDGNKLPAPAIDGAFNLTIYNADDPFVAPEIVRVTARSGDTLTVTRAQEGTSATNKTSGSTWNVELTPTAKTIQDIDSAKLDVAGGTMTGDLTIPDKIIHSSDTNTAIRFPANDTFAIETNGTEKIRATSTAVVVNESGLDQDFRVEGDTDANLLFVDASEDKVCIGTTQSKAKLQVNNLANDTSFFSLVGGEAIIAGNSVTVSKTQRGILHIDNNQVNAVNRNASLTFGLGGSQFTATYYVVGGAIRTEIIGTGNLTINPSMIFSVLDGASTTGTLVDRLEITYTGLTKVNGILAPSTDDTRTLGTAGLRWSEVFAGNGTINTSDETEKQDIAELDEAEQQVAIALKGLIRKYRWIDAVERKGEDARIHVGVMAQDVAQAFIDNGLDPERYGVFCKDTWYTKEETYFEQVPNPEFNEEAEEGEDNPRTINGEEKTRTVYCESNDEGATEHIRYGVRYDQLWAFIIAGL